MYTIKQAAARTGLTIATIRAWERRYGVIRPSRTAAGYRLYDDESIARLIAMRYLVSSDGWGPSQAAERVLAAGADYAALTPGALEVGSGMRPVEPGMSSERPSDVAVDAFLAAARLLDVAAMEQVLGESFAAQRFELAVESLAFPALRAIGDAWSAGELDVAIEHAASETVRRKLAHFFDAAARGDRAPKVIVGLPPTGHHEIGAFAFAVAARRVGLDVLYLGADVPLESWLATFEETTALVAVLAVVIPSDIAAAAAVVEALGAMARPPTCALGGPLARKIPRTRRTVWLPEPIDDAVTALLEILDAADAARPRRPTVPARTRLSRR
jgi:methanogenic corrinoid protein MtbC1